MQRELLGRDEDELWGRYIEDGYKKGAGRAFDDARMRQLRKERPELFTPEAQGALRDFYRGSKDEFLRSAFARPVSVERVRVLAARTFTDLRGVTEDMAARMNRTLTDGLVQGQSPREVAADLAEEVDISFGRAERIARTETIRAHAEGQLEGLEQLGVEEVGVQVEWTVTNDSKLCPECEEMSGFVVAIADARGLIPMHPNCRCAWIPVIAGVIANIRSGTTRAAVRVSRERLLEIVANIGDRRHHHRDLRNW